MRVIGRLKPDVTIGRAQADMDTVARRLAQTYREDAGVTAYLVPALLQITGSVRPALLVLFGAVGFVLLIACANLSNLLLARSTSREKEFAVRAALGAGRLDLVRQLLTECVLLSLLGGALGILLALPGIRYLRLILATQIPRAQDIGLDPRVLLFTLGLTVLTGAAVGLLPALRLYKGRLNESLKQGSRSGGAGLQGRRVRDLLVVSEVALALMLLGGAGLLVKSFERVSAIDPGFNPDKVLTCRVSLPPTYKDPQIVAFFQQLLDRLRALQGVKAGGATMTLPLQSTGGGFWGGLNIEGRPAVSRESIPIVSFVQVTPGYFRAMGIPSSEALRTSSDPLSLAAAVRSAVHELDKDQSVANIQTLNQVVSASLAQPRLNALLLGGFAGLALLLAAIGIYGVISYMVALRTREIGLRMALGAQRGDVLKLVVQQGMIPALAGAAVGLVGALLLARLMSSLLYGIQPSDPPTFLAVFIVLVGVALFASYIPARRATKLDPMGALRHE